MFIIFIGNYPLDRQRSMEAYAAMMVAQAGLFGHSCTVLTPRVLLGRLSSSESGISKWLGYVDKFVFFPFALLVSYWAKRLTGKQPVGVHIVDHSNAMYSLCLPRAATAVTCHDMLAIRAGLGESGTGCVASGLGRVLQRWILRGLHRSGQVVCVSQTTLDDYTRLACGEPRAARAVLIHNALNGHFEPLEDESVACVLSGKLPFTPNRNYLLHIGSSLSRKNRGLLIEVFARRRQAGWDGWLVFAGAGESSDMSTKLDALGVRDRVCFLGEVSHQELNALYSGACALLFPSYTEGFGWPPVEANATGCPVLASNTTSLPEVCGEGAQLFDPDDVEGFTAGLAALEDPTIRAEWIERGFRNAKRFTREAMAEAYRKVYEELGSRH